MQELKSMVNELFQQDQQLNLLQKEMKTKMAQYNHLLLRNSEKVYGDAEIIAINSMFEELSLLKQQQEAMVNKSETIKCRLKQFVVPLNGGRWLTRPKKFFSPTGNSGWKMTN